MRFRSIGVLLCLLFVASCGSRNTASLETQFSPASNTAFLIGGAEHPGSNPFGCTTVYIYQLDGDTEQYISGPYVFHSKDTNTDAYVVPPGHYLVGAWDTCFKRIRVQGPNLVRGIFADRSKSSFKDASARRFVLKPGEVRYIGHFNGSFWSDRPQEAENLLSQMENVKGNLVTKLPTISSSFEGFK